MDYDVNGKERVVGIDGMKCDRFKSDYVYVIKNTSMVIWRFFDKSLENIFKIHIS